MRAGAPTVVSDVQALPSQPQSVSAGSAMRPFHCASGVQPPAAQASAAGPALVRQEPMEVRVAISCTVLAHWSLPGEPSPCWCCVGKLSACTVGGCSCSTVGWHQACPARIHARCWLGSLLWMCPPTSLGSRAESVSTCQCALAGRLQRAC